MALREQVVFRAFLDIVVRQVPQAHLEDRDIAAQAEYQGPVDLVDIQEIQVPVVHLESVAFPGLVVTAGHQEYQEPVELREHPVFQVRADLVVTVAYRGLVE